MRRAAEEEKTHDAPLFFSIKHHLLTINNNFLGQSQFVSVNWWSVWCFVLDFPVGVDVDITYGGRPSSNYGYFKYITRCLKSVKDNKTRDRYKRDNKSPPLLAGNDHNR